MTGEQIATALESLKDTCYTIANEHGFWKSDRPDTECLLLIHSEVSEAVGALRHGNPHAEHIPPEYTAVEEELADIIIRVLDLCGKRDYDISGALLAKIAYNRTRPYKHGKNL